MQQIRVLNWIYYGLIVEWDHLKALVGSMNSDFPPKHSNLNARSAPCDPKPSLCSFSILTARQMAQMKLN